LIFLDKNRIKKVIKPNKIKKSSNNAKLYLSINIQLTILTVKINDQYETDLSNYRHRIDNLNCLNCPNEGPCVISLLTKFQSSELEISVLFKLSR